MMQHKWKVAGLACSLMAAILFSTQGGPAAASSKGQEIQGHRQVAIVIDDFGNGMTGTPEMMELPVRFTVAVMPFMPTTKQDAELAFKRGDDVIVHMPMEPVKGKPEWLGPGAITTSMSDDEIRKRVEAAIADVPHAVGMNNHMGSKATSDERVMRAVLSVVKEHGMFFLDSRTSYRTVLPKVTKELGVPLLSNQVFLDDVYTTKHISKQVGVMRKYLEDNDSCVIIGHVGPPGKLTAAVLKDAIPRLQATTSFVKLSEMVLPSAEKDIIPHP
ncbi:divergent polysaccharide deacetylase family protein [Paenibacillus montanisoli]|uniref:Divergent polysaccharide deacetylase family protein n=1 Tax=Paenibacillus montanisoli TaxID=2081970 RepID=A0A328U5K2_9BACL|nr:divergent polysaccharide deacetylase family protein [Paenibacillus montanisoli]RAP78027.1 divergent polysaccharide deacetylase family protein [Paenibacillus montanisoli]